MVMMMMPISTAATASLITTKIQRIDSPASSHTGAGEVLGTLLLVLEAWAGGFWGMT